ncbi:MAG: Npt1/Npt2 family nucleotide transporter, partial [Chlamydiota bacterium]
GGLISATLATRIGTQNLFFFTVFIYFFLFLSYQMAIRQNKNAATFQESFSASGVKLSSVVSLIKNSKLLLFVLCIVLLMQISVAFVDYQFNIFVENAIPTVDKRTQYMGWLLSVTNGCTVFLQFFGTFFFLQRFGLKKSHLLVPVLLNVNAIFLLLFPSFSVAACSFATIKTMDYSFFTVIREMLYIPMKLDEKFRAKAVIDVFVYRSAKAFASVFLLIVQIFLPINILLLTGCMSIVVFCCWIFVVFYMFRHYERQVEPEAG